MVPSSPDNRTMSSKSSPRARLAWVRSTSPPASVRSSPEERFNDAWRTSRATSPMVSRCLRSASSFTSMLISRSGTANGHTTDTEGRASKASRTSSARLRSSGCDNEDDATATVSTFRDTSANATSGCSASGGGNLSSRSTADWTSSSTSFGFANTSKSTTTVPKPSMAREVTRSTPASGIRRSSIRRLTSSSTSRALEPGYGTSTVICRASNSGTLWISRCKTV